MEHIFNNFKISNYEFHLSYKDVENFDVELMKSQSENLIGKTFSYHLPDYLNNYQLFDPLSFTKEIKERSNKLLQKAIKISQVYSTDDENPIIFVSSLSQNNFSNKDEYFKNLSEFINKMFNKYNILFLPQWLPKKAWYFGGSYDISLFSNSDDINFIKKYKMQICLDTAHLIMSANSENANWKSWLDQLLPFTKHIHLSDSYGTDGEGVNFGEGELGNPKKLIAFEGAKVLEVWQGHLNEFKGFKSAVRDLRKFE
jgi:N-acetylneuraminate synthase